MKEVVDVCVSSFISYFCAGVSLTNSLPDLTIGITGRRNLTPFGADSSALVNALWGSIKLIGGYLLIRRADKQTGAMADLKTWLIPYDAGCVYWSLFDVLYAYFTEGHRLHKSSPDV